MELKENKVEETSEPVNIPLKMFQTIKVETRLVKNLEGNAPLPVVGIFLHNGEETEEGAGIALTMEQVEALERLLKRCRKKVKKANLPS